MKKHFLLLALAAICSLSVFGQTVTASWGRGGDKPLPSSGNPQTSNEITCQTTMGLTSNSIAGEPTVYMFDWSSDRNIDITTDGLEITGLFAGINYGDDANSVIANFSPESDFDDDPSAVTSVAIPGNTDNVWGAFVEYEVLSVPEGTQSIRISRSSNSWGPMFYYLKVTAKPAPAPVGPVDPKIKLNDGTYYLGTSGLDLSTLFSSKNKESAVTYQIKTDNGTNASLNGSVLTATTAGTVVVTASQPAVDGKYLEGSADATITVTTAPVHAYAQSVDFVALANQGSRIEDGNLVASKLQNLNYSISETSGIVLDPGDTEDAGFGIEATPRTLSFWVKANHKVTIAVGVLCGYGDTHGTNEATLTQHDIYGNQISSSTIYAHTTATDNTYTTTQETEFRFTTNSGGWSRVQNIDIKPLSFTVSYDKNGGSGDDVTPQEKAAGVAFNLGAADTFTPPTGYHFKEWSCSYDSKSYAAGVTYTMPASDVTFTAIWEEDSEVEYTVEYANGGGTWTDGQPTEVNHKAGDTFTLPASSVVEREGYQFAGWNDGTNTFAAEATYTMPAKAVTLTAQWNQLYTVTYAKGEVDYTGILPTQEPQIASASFKVAAGIKCQGYAFKGWKAGATTYQPNDDFTMPASAVEFVAQWEAVIVPVVTDLAVKSPDNNIVPLVWNIPGLVDMSKAAAPYQATIDPTDKTPKLDINDDGSVTTTFTLGPSGNSGVGFPIPSSVVDKVSFEYKVTLPNSGCWMWGGAGAAEKKVNWQGQGAGQMSGDKADWTLAQCTMSQAYWTGNKHTDADNQVAVYMNSNGTYDNASFSVRNVRYHCTGMSDVLIDKVVVMRKEGSASTGLDDGTEIYRGALSSFTDKLNTTTDVNKTFYYTVFALDADENASEGVSVSYAYVVKEPHAVTYVAGADDVTGDLPAAGSYKENFEFNLPEAGNLARSGYSFNGWNDGKTTYQPGDEYTMPDNDVTFTALWKSYDHIPQVTTLDIANYTATNSTLAPMTIDGGTCVDLYTQKDEMKYVDWKVFIKPGNYTVSYRAGTDQYGWHSSLYVLDASTMQVIAGEHNTTYRNQGFATIEYNWNLSDLDPDKLYIVRAANEYSGGGSHLKVHYVNFEFVQSTPTASFATASKELYPEETFTQTVTTNSDGDVTYSSNNTDVATIDPATGEVTAVAKGQATITATIAETADYKSTTATYTINVLKASGPIYLDPGTDKLKAIMNDLEDGDVIVFRDGEFTETTNLSFSKAVTLRADEDASPVLNCTYFQVTKGITVDGLTINSTTTEPLFRIQGIGADMIFRNCTMHNNAYCFYQQGTIANFVMDNCVITSNSSIAVQLSSPATNISITNSTFINNGSNSLYLSGSATSVLIDHCTFYNNTQNTYTILATGSQTTISNSVFYNQNVGGGPAIYGNGTKPNVNNCIIKNWNTTTTNTNNTNLMTVDPQLVVDENGMYYRPNSPIVGAATDGSNLGDPRWKIYYITITDQDTDDALLESYNGKKANVEVIRPLTAGMTNSICLPFALNREQIDDAFGTGAKVWNLTESTLSANNMTLDIEFNQVEAMAAGVPYLIEPGEGYDRDVNPIFYGVTVSTALVPVEQANLDFIGTVQKSFVSVGYKDHLFVGSGNMVYYPSGSGDLKGMRAYFVINYHAGDVPAAGVSARMILGKTTPTELRTPKATDSVQKVMKEGRIYIIRNGVVNDMFGNTVK